MIVPTKVLSDPMELESTLQSNLLQHQQSVAAAAAVAAAQHAASNGFSPFDPATAAAAHAQAIQQAHHNGEISVIVSNVAKKAAWPAIKV